MRLAITLYHRFAGDLRRFENNLAPTYIQEIYRYAW